MASLMLREIREVPDLLLKQGEDGIFAEKGLWLKGLNPKALWLLARGSSAHAGNYLGYLWMRYLACPASLIPLSLSTFYKQSWQASEALLLAISQSGKSEDLLTASECMGSAALASVALVNSMDAPLVRRVQCALDVGAGEEKSVAATKSFLLSVSAGLRLFAPLWQDEGLQQGLGELPSALCALREGAFRISHGFFELCEAERLFVIGRGEGFALAQEAALKFKETCLIQAEALSGAEVMHGPMALMNDRQWVLFFVLPDEMQESLLETARRFQKMGARVLLVAPEEGLIQGMEGVFYGRSAGHFALHGLAAMFCFYHAVERLACLRGLDPDAPPHLQKATSTR